MSYYLRAFCTSSTVPSLRSVIDGVAAQGCPLEVVPEDECVALDAADWRSVSLQYKTGKLVFQLEVALDDGSPDCLLRDEIEEFEELLEDVEDSPAKQRVLDHLRASRFVVAIRLPTGDIDEDGYRASGLLLDFFVAHAGGMIQADGEGFYDGATLLVELS